MQKLLKYTCTIILLILVYFGTLYITSLIPQTALKTKVSESAEILAKQGNNFFIKIPNKNKYIKFDNYTDALMINTAYSIDSNEPLISSLVCRKNYIPGTTVIEYQDTVSELKSASKYPEINQVAELNDTVNGDIGESFEYARYWHGYLVPLRILLCIFNITEIRTMFILLFLVLIITLMILITKKLNIYSMLVFLVALISVDYFYIGISLQGSSIFFITMLASIALIYRYDKIKDFSLLFLIIGSLTSFFDFLTVPILTLGIPFTIFFLIKRKRRINNKRYTTMDGKNRICLGSRIFCNMVCKMGYCRCVGR